MTWGTVIGAIAVGAVVAGSPYNHAAAQVVAPEGRVYVFHSKALGTCPALDWHVVVGAGNTLNGMVAWDDMKAMATVTGSIATDRKFTMNAKESGGQRRTAIISGQVRGDGWLIANIKGPKIDCEGIAVPWFIPPPPGSG